MVSSGFSKRLPSILTAAALFLGLSATCLAQDSDKDKKDSGDQATQGQGDPLKRPLTDKQKKAAAKALRQELGKTYKKWLSEDVIWIITDEER